MFELPEIPLPVTTVNLDWRAYFNRFSRAHGGDPVQYRNRLLFRDGWTYSATDYGGPEWAPPEDLDEKRLFIVAYWTRRRQIVLFERDQLAITLRELRHAQELKSVPLQQAIRYEALNVDGKPTMATAVGDIDFEALQGRLDWLTLDMDQCNQKLRELTKDD